MIWLNMSQARKALSEIADRMYSGEKLGCKEIMLEYFECQDKKYRDSFQELLKVNIKSKASRWLGTDVKRVVWKKYKVPVCILDDEGHYGIPSTDGEVAYNTNIIYPFQKGTVKNQMKLIKYASRNKILPKNLHNETLSVPKIVQSQLTSSNG